MNERVTAIHEAGHAVAFYRLWPVGRYGGSLTIEPRLEMLGSHSAEEMWFPESDRLTDDEREECWRQEAVYSCAGYAALIAAGYPEDIAAEGCDSDFEKAEQAHPQGLEAAKAQAVELMRKPENVAAVRRLVEELIMRRTIDEDLVDILIDVADGKTTEAQYQRYLLLRDSAQRRHEGTE